MEERNVQRMNNDESAMSKMNPLGDKALIGAPLGKFRVTIRCANQTFHTELEGELYDATTRFTNPWLITQFKRAVCDEIVSIHPMDDGEIIFEEEEPDDVIVPSKNQKALPKPSLNIASVQEAERSDIEKTVKDFKRYPLGQVARVLILDEGYTSDKHIILQVGNLLSLTDYATIPERLKRSLVKGEKVTFSVAGKGLSLPTRRALPDGLGKGYIHWFIPDDHIGSGKVDLKALRGADVLSGIIPWMHQTLEIKEYKKAKEEQIKAGQDSLKEMGGELKAATTTNDLMDLILSRLRRHGDKDNVPIKRGDFYDFLCYTIPTLLFGVLGWATVPSSTGIFGGVTLGLLFGGYLTYRRR